MPAEAGARVLLIDMDPERRGNLERRLREAGFAVETSPDFPTEDVVLDKRPGAVVCTAAPGLNDAIEFCAGVRSQKALQGTPLLVVAEREEEILRLRFLESGADDVVTEDALLHILPLRAAAAKGRSSSRALEERQVDTVDGARTTLGQATQSQMYFRLAAGELANALQFLCTTRRSGELRVEVREEAARGGESRLRGRVFVKDGKLVHAECGEETGINALALLINMPDLEARFYEGVTTEQSSLAGGHDHILIQASVLSDELRALLSEIPDDTVFAINPDAEAPEDLGEQAAAILMEIDGARDVAAVLNAVDVTRVQGMMILKELRDQNLIRPVPPEIAARNRARSILQTLTAEIENALESMSDANAALSFAREVERAVRPLLSRKRAPSKSR